MNLKTPAILSLPLFVSFVIMADEEPVSLSPGDKGTASTEVTADSIPEQDFTDLEELVVVQRKKLVESDGAKLSYNVSEDPEAGTSNILDILRKVPGVTVDADENVKVNGQSSFKILMNGREDPLLKGDIKTVLKSIPASSILKIEVISEPGAKYEAEGVGGILNIVTDRKQTLSGFMTQLGAWTNAYHVGGYLNARAKFNKVMLDANISYNNGKVWERTASSERTYEYLDGGANKSQTIRSKAKQGWDYTGISLNMSWEPDSLNLFTLSGNYGYNSWRNNGLQESVMMGRDDHPIWELRRDFFSSGLYNGLGAQTSYQHNFGRDDHNFILSYEVDYGPQHNTTDYLASYLLGTGAETPFSSQKSKTNYWSHIVQLDYINRFNSNHLLEAGGKVNINRTANLSQAFMGASEAEAAEIDGLAVDVTQLKDIYALYGSYSGTFSKWNVKGGLRYEYTRMGMRYKIGSYPDFTSRLSDLVPNAAISYNLADATTLRFAYQMRISRPYISQVNPYINIFNPNEIQYGNPELKSVKGHTFSLGYSNYEGKFTGSAKLTYRFTDNEINDIIFMRDGIMNSTYANVGKSHLGMLDLSADWNITPELRWSVYLSESYTYIKADSEMLKAKNHGWQTSLSSNVNYTFPSKLRLTAYGGFYTPWIDLQSRGTKDMYYYGFSGSKSWLKDDALTVSLSVSNPFPTHRTNSFEQEDPTVSYRYTGRIYNWNVGLSISFKFGGLTASVKKTSANIEKEGNGGGGSKGN